MQRKMQILKKMTLETCWKIFDFITAFFKSTDDVTSDDECETDDECEVSVDPDSKKCTSDILHEKLHKYRKKQKQLHPPRTEKEFKLFIMLYKQLEYKRGPDKVFAVGTI